MCALNILQDANIFDVGDGENEHTDEDDYYGQEKEEEEEEIGVKDKTEAIYTAVVDELASSTLGDLAKMGHQLEDLVQSCTFKGYSCRYRLPLLDSICHSDKATCKDEDAG